MKDISDPSDETHKAAAAGLCASCLYARPIESDRGSIFILCELSLVDPWFPKYPRLPVLSCQGYIRGMANPPTAVSS